MMTAGLSGCSAATSRGCMTALEVHSVRALQAQNLSGFLRRCGVEAEPVDDLAHLHHLGGVALGQPSTAQPETVFQADAHIAAQGRADRSDGHLLASRAEN